MYSSVLPPTTAIVCADTTPGGLALMVTAVPKLPSATSLQPPIRGMLAPITRTLATPFKTAISNRAGAGSMVFVAVGSWSSSVICAPTSSADTPPPARVAEYSRVTPPDCTISRSVIPLSRLTGPPRNVSTTSNVYTSYHPQHGWTPEGRLACTDLPFLNGLQPSLITTIFFAVHDKGQTGCLIRISLS